MKNKFIELSQAASYIKDDMTVMIGGFIGNGSPDRIIDEVVKSGAKNLTLILNDTAFPDRSCGKLVVNRQVKKVIVSHIGTNPVTGELMNKGELDVEFSPQGTLIERIRCGGAGLGGVLTPTGIGTMIEEGKKIINIDGKEFLLEKPLRADVAIIKGSIADESGNICYKGTTKNFNIQMATAADLVIAEVDKVVKVGDILPENVHTQAIFVDYLVK